MDNVNATGKHRTKVVQSFRWECTCGGHGEAHGTESAARSFGTRHEIASVRRNKFAPKPRIVGPAYDPIPERGKRSHP